MIDKKALRERVERARSIDWDTVVLEIAELTDLLDELDKIEHALGDEDPAND